MKKNIVSGNQFGSCLMKTRPKTVLASNHPPVFCPCLLIPRIPGSAEERCHFISSLFSCRRYVGQPQLDGETRQIAPDRSFAASAGLSEGHPGKTAWIIHSSFRLGGVGGGAGTWTFRSLAPTGKGWVPGADRLPRCERIYLPLSLKIEPASAFRDIILKSSGVCSTAAEHFRWQPVNWICEEHRGQLQEDAIWICHFFLFFFREEPG